MSSPIMSPTGLDGVIASGNTPVWIIQEETITSPLSSESKSIPLSALKAATTVKADCHMNMDGVDFTRNPTKRDRKRMCEKITSSVKTGETIDGKITAIYDQQAEAKALINAVYTALPEGKTVYVARAYGWDASKAPSTEMKVDVWRGTVQQRAKNQTVDGEDLEFTADLSADLYIQDATVTA